MTLPCIFIYGTSLQKINIIIVHNADFFCNRYQNIDGRCKKHYTFLVGNVSRMEAYL